MKRFIISVLFVSVFFIGLGGIFEKASAKFNSDEKALQLIRQARIAVGGDAAIENVKSMTINGTTTNYLETETAQDIKQGTLEINFELPNRYFKNLRIGDPDNTAGGKIQNETEVLVMRNENSGNAAWKASADNKIKIQDNKIVIEKADGTVDEIKTEGKHRFVIRKDADGNVLTENIEGAKNIVIKDLDGNVLTENELGESKMILEKAAEFGQFQFRNNEMLRITIALLLTPPQGLNVSYKFLGEGNVDGYQTNIIDVDSNGSSFKLHLDSATNLPRMISYIARPNVLVSFNKDIAENSADKRILLEKRLNKTEPVEHQVRFSDFRAAGNLFLPHSWTETVGGKQTQTVSITNYEINPANIDKKFKDQKVFVRKIKPSENN